MSNLNNPKYRAAMAANAKLMHDSGERPLSTMEDVMAAMSGVKPVSERQQIMLEAMRNQTVNILLVFGPGHGHTMQLNGSPADEIMWQEYQEPIWGDMQDPHESIRAAKRGIHRYRREDELESHLMEECVIYVHHERCCEARMPKHRRSSRPW